MPVGYGDLFAFLVAVCIGLPGNPPQGTWLHAFGNRFGPASALLCGQCPGLFLSFWMRRNFEARDQRAILHRKDQALILTCIKYEIIAPVLVFRREVRLRLLSYQSCSLVKRQALARVIIAKKYHAVVTTRGLSISGYNPQCMNVWDYILKVPPLQQLSLREKVKDWLLPNICLSFRVNNMDLMAPDKTFRIWSNVNVISHSLKSLDGPTSLEATAAGVENLIESGVPLRIYYKAPNTSVSNDDWLTSGWGSTQRRGNRHYHRAKLTG